MKKKVKLFSSALALGMLLGTGAGSLSVVTQQVPGTTMTAKADEGTEVKLSEDQVIVNYDGYITDIDNLSQEDVEAIATGGKLSIPLKGTRDDGEDTVVTIRGITEDMFSKDNLQSLLGLEDFDGLKSVTFADDSKITDIRESAFEGNQLTDITLPESLENIGPMAFKDNQLASIHLPESLETIEYAAFQNNQLTSITLPESLEIIGSNSFENNQLANVILPENLKTIAAGTFQNNQLTSVTLPENLETIESDAFRDNKLADVKFPDAVKNIHDNAFKNNQLEEVELTSIEHIGADAFSKNKIKTVSLNKGHEYINDQEGTINNPDVGHAFRAQSWGSLTMPYSPTISNEDFAGKLNLTYVMNDLELGAERYSVASISNATNLSWNGDRGGIITVKSEEGGSANIGLDVYRNHVSMSGSVRLNVDPVSDTGENGNGEDGNNGGGSGGDNSGGITQPDNNNNSGNNNGGTTQPDTDNNNNTTPSTPATPGTSNNHPYSVYATRAMRLHKNVSLTSPTKSYKKQSRAKAPSFKIQGVAYDKNGKKRYKVKGGYITASSKYVADSHFRSNKVKRVRVIGNKVNSYKDVKLSKNQKLGSYKKGTKIKVSRIVKYGRTTRFQLPNGRYITGNKQLLIMDQK
ncbi:hypothetical protein IWT140_01649 [Secundilactobacillus pentosiphilus]|uniref:DUF5776 domain-containing protein n=1 Tax=Secundilactobacillus pentosiphilus TaxID=1714682 RepID=A0A1Z5IQH2_9LACO|nr:leucine-rich repeat protein [Secundilactobacillus pentosiphilus]GAX04015.1 hypothetical protein IWT140_01649 [Secundilactobacillus pentosiphilus]